MRKFIKRAVVILAAVVSVGAVTTGPAWATGGGCRSYADTTPCISTGRIGDYIYGDFYQYASLDSSRYYYRLQIWVGRDGQPWVLKKDYKAPPNQPRLDHLGHYAQQSVHVAALPSVNEHAFTRIIIYNSARNEHYRHDSPTVYYRT